MRLLTRNETSNFGKNIAQQVLSKIGMESIVINIVWHPVDVKTHYIQTRILDLVEEKLHEDA